MRSLSDTIARIASLKRAQARSEAETRPQHLGELVGFGDNPGALRAKIYVPAGLPENAALVVVLHGCTQTAAGYDAGAGWSRLAEREKFAVLLPEQQRANNAALCFNWFSPEDTRRDRGEAASIVAMVEAMIAAHRLDASRVFVTGLSAGGAMAATLLAAYPEKFAAGAIIAGLPHGIAATVPEAFDRMRGHGIPDAATLEATLRLASAHAGPWPAVAVWHGDGDRTVDPANAEALLAQWLAVHGLDPAPAAVVTAGDHVRRTWRGPDGRVVVEAHVIADMGHGTPLDPADGLGTAGAYMLDVGVSSTLEIARFFGLADASEIRLPAARKPAAPAAKAANDVGSVIENALRSAGLMR